MLPFLEYNLEFLLCCFVYICFMIADISGSEFCSNHLVTGPDGVTDDKISASTEYNSELIAPRARLNSPFSSSWTAARNDMNPFIQVDFDKTKLIRAIMTMGRLGSYQYVISYRISYRLDENDWTRYQDEKGNDVVFPGNIDVDSIVTNDLKRPIIATQLRLNPMDWNRMISLRFEVIGCNAANRDHWRLHQISISDLKNSLWNKSTSDVGACAIFCFQETHCQSFVFNGDVNTCSAFSQEYFYGFRMLKVQGNMYFLRSLTWDSRRITDENNGYTFTHNLIYKLYTTKMSGNKANEKCKSDGYALLFVRNVATMNLLQRMFWDDLNPLLTEQSVFTGGSNQDGKWMYNNDEVPEELWKINYPVDFHPKCMTLTPKGLINNNCFIARSFVCGF